MKSIRFYVTERCNAKCPNCFNSNVRNNSEMDMAHFVELCRFFSSQGYFQLKMMGGEPTVHWKFEDLFIIAQKYFRSVNIFTNAINNKILGIAPREADGIIYNFKFAKAITKEKLLLNYPGKRALEVQITAQTNKDLLMSEIKRVADFSLDRIEVDLTLDCTAEIFLERDTIVPIYEFVLTESEKSGIHIGQDHLIPFCYLLNTQIPTAKGGAICSLYCAGLIDAKYNIRFCNQFPEILGNLFAENKITSAKHYDELVSSKFKEIQDGLQRKSCSACPYWNVVCNGGCFMGRVKHPINISI